MAAATNPISKVRGELQMSRRELAVTAQVPYAEVCKSELGYPLRLNSKLARFLSASGYPGDPGSDYLMWRAEAGRALREAARGG